MRGRTGGAPSTKRLKLVYYYVRLVVVLLVSTTSRGQRARRTADREAAVGTDVSTEAHILVIVLAAAVIVFIVHLVRSRQLRAKYSVLWFSIGLALAVLGDLPRPARLAVRPVRHRLPARHLHVAGVELPAPPGAALLVGAVAPRRPHPGARRRARVAPPGVRGVENPRGVSGVSAPRLDVLRRRVEPPRSSRPRGRGGRAGRAAARRPARTVHRPKGRGRHRAVGSRLHLVDEHRVLERLPMVTPEHRVERVAGERRDVIRMVHLEVGKRGDRVR